MEDINLIPDFSVGNGSKVAHFKSSLFIDTKRPKEYKGFYGNIGQALINQFNKMTISFKNSLIVFE